MSLDQLSDDAIFTVLMIFGIGVPAVINFVLALRDMRKSRREWMQ